MRATIRGLVAGLAVIVVSGAGASGAAASLAHPPTPHPAEAPPGASVRVDGWPELDPHCPAAAMWLAKEMGISAQSDPRLIALQGVTTIEKGLGQASAGPLVDVPVFTFTVPSVASGSYVLYYSCPGSPTGWDSLFEGAAFTVLAALPGTDLPRSNGLPAAAFAALFLLVVAVVFLLPRRRGPV